MLFFLFIPTVNFREDVITMMATWEVITQFLIRPTPEGAVLQQFFISNAKPIGSVPIKIDNPTSKVAKKPHTT